MKKFTELRVGSFFIYGENVYRKIGGLKAVQIATDVYGCIIELDELEFGNQVVIKINKLY